MLQLVLLFHIIIAIAIIGLVLLQQGKGAGMGAAFGSGSSQALFGSRGPASFLMKLTGGLAFLFFVTSLGLGYISVSHIKAQKDLQMPMIKRVVPGKKASDNNGLTVPALNQTEPAQSPASEPNK